MKKIKNKKTRDAEILERQKFLDIYSEFDKWLRSLNFRSGHYWKESSKSMDYHYSHYDKHIDSLCSVEHYLQDAVKLSIRFLRDRNEHKIMFVGTLGSYSKVYTLDEAKELIISEVRKLRDEKLKELSELQNI